MKKIIGLIFCVKAFDLRKGISDGSRACSEEDQDRKSLCESVCGEVVGACVTKCGGFDGDQSCVSVCKREGWECVDECPCNDNCSDGCVRCDNWACKDDNILVMNKAINEVVIFSPTGENGQTMVADGFVYEMNTGVDASCSVLYSGRMLVFGGYESKSYAKQISEVVKSPKCKLSPVGTLPLKFAFGACNVVDNKVLLCFAEGVENECDSFDGQQVEIKDPVHDGYIIILFYYMYINTLADNSGSKLKIHARCDLAWSVSKQRHCNWSYIPSKG